MSVRSGPKAGGEGRAKKVAQRTRARPFTATWSATGSTTWAAVGALELVGRLGGVQGGAITGILRPRAMPEP